MKDSYFICLIFVLAMYHISSGRHRTDIQSEVKQLRMAMENYQFVEAEKP